jgi:DNA-directed RNA polymerase subunit M/transcription elongation factor TFIIS
MQFCPGCQDLLIVSGNDNVLNFSCEQCEREFSIEDLKITTKGNNYILYERDLTVSEQHLRLIKNACDDIRNPRKYMFCPTCKKNKVVVFIKVPNTLQNIYICCDCKEYFR